MKLESKVQVGAQGGIEEVANQRWRMRQRIEPIDLRDEDGQHTGQHFCFF